MAISDDLNSIRTHLEDNYKALEQLGVSAEDRNIENIKDMANQIYAKFPKTEFQEGSNITLSNTLKGKLDFEDDIVGYGQTSQKSYQGYQLIPYTLETLKAINTTGTWNGNAYTYNGITYTIEEENGYIKEIKTTGTATSNSILALISTLDISAGTYYLSGCPNGGSYSTYFIYSGPGLVHNVSETPTTITLNEDTTLSSNNMRITILSGINLSNLIWKPMLSKTNTTNFEPYVGGISSPNSSYPQDIEVVRGKNLWGGIGTYSTNNSITNSDGTIDLNINNSTVISATTSNALANNLIKKLEAGTYTFSSNVIENLTVEMIKVSGTSGSVFKQCYYNQDHVNFTITESIEYFIRVNTSTNITYQGTIKPMIKKSSQATSYLPYNTLEVVERGKNLLNTANGSVAYKPEGTITIDSKGVINASIDMSYASINIPSITLKAGKTYTFKRNFTGSRNSWFVDTNNNNVLGIGYNKTSETTTFETDTVINKLNGALLSGDNYFWLEEGSTATDFEPYITPKTYQLSLGDKELYEDCYIVGTPNNWKFVDNWYKLTSSVLSGFTIALSDSGGKKFVVTKTYFVGVPKPKVGKVYCTHLKYNSSAWYADGYCGIVSPGATLWMQMTQVFESVEAFKTFIITNNMEILYQTEEPIETPITDETLISQLNAWYNAHSNNGTTIITSYGDLPIIIKVRGLKG